MNQTAAKYQNQQLQDAATHLELYDLLKQNGNQWAYQLSKATGEPTATVRWHLREMQKRGEVKFRAGWGYGGMTLSQWREANRLRWHDVARKLSEQGCGPIMENRLNRLRQGTRPTIDEVKALCLLTDDCVDSYNEPD